MKEYTYSSEETQGWKSYPVRVQGPKLSRCCQATSLLVQSMKGGFVTSNCAKCGKRSTLTRPQFEALHLWVSCPECGRKMEPGMFIDNYGYRCESCRVFIQLATLLPFWDDIAPQGQTP